MSPPPPQRPARPNRLRAAARTAGRILLLLLAVVASLELGSRAALRMLGGSLVHHGLELKRDAPVLLAPDGEELPAGFDWMADEVLHPYVGYVSETPEERIWTHGFMTATPPSHRRGDEIRVATLGGSLAQRVQPALHRELLRALEERGIKRKVLFAQLAYPGFKQPQQLQTIAYFLSLGSDFDLIVNIDGYNELALSIAENHIASVFPFFPRRWDERVARVPNRDRLREIGRITTLRDLQGTIITWAGRSSLRHSATVRLVAELALRAIDRPLVAARERLRTMPVGSGFEQHGPFRPYKKTEVLIEAMATNWARSSQLLHQLAKENGAEYHHFLQPNQYLPGSKQLTDEEKRSAYDPEVLSAEVIRLGYPVMLRHAKRLERQGVRFHDATQAFADVEETLYMDVCCHVNERGDEILARFLVEQILASTDLAALRDPDTPTRPRRVKGRAQAKAGAVGAEGDRVDLGRAPPGEDHPPVVP